MSIILGNKREENNGTEEESASTIAETVLAEQAAESTAADHPQEEEQAETPTDVAAQAAENPDEVRDGVVQKRRRFLHEDARKRERNGKHYVGNDGTTTAIFKSKAVHYSDPADGKLKDIDNGLSDTGDGLETKANDFRTKFIRDSADGKVFEMSKCGCKVGLFSREAAEKGGCQLERCDCGEDSDGASEVVLKNVKENVDIQYIVDSDRVKENIVIKWKSDGYEYNFDISIENLTAGVSEDGKTLQLKGADGEVRFFIPGPFMTDANGEYSDSVYYEIDSQEDNMLKLKVLADAEWLNAEGRAFPVVIDPQIVSADTSLYTNQSSSRSTSSGSSGTAAAWSTYATNSAYLYAGISGTTEYKAALTIRKSFMNIRLQKISKAVLKLKAYSGSGYCDVYASGAYIGYPSFSAAGYTAVDITGAFIAASGDLTVEFTAQSSALMYLYASGTYAPILEVEYLTGDDSVPAKKSFSFAGGVSGELNLSTGELAASFADVSAGGSALRLEIAHVYKKSDTDYNCGDDWRLNLHQTLVKNTASNVGVDYIYTDAAGEKHGFIETYYYLNNDNGKSIINNKSDITVELDGSLSCAAGTSIVEVFKDQRTATGLKLTTVIDGFKYAEHVEQRQEEQIQLEEGIRSYKNNLKEYVAMNVADGINSGVITHEIKGFFLNETKNGVVNDVLTKAAFKSFLTQADTGMVLTRSEALQYNSLLLQKTSAATTARNVGKLVGTSTYANTDYSDSGIARKFATGAYSKYLIDLKRLVKDLNTDYATLLKKSNYGVSGLNYQYDEYMDYLGSKGYVSGSNCCVTGITGVGSQAALTVNPAASNTITNLTVPYSHLSNNYCDLQAELERIADDLDMVHRGQGDLGAVYVNERERQKVLEQRLRLFQKEFSNRTDKLRINIERVEQEINAFMETEQRKLVDEQLAMITGKAAQNLDDLKRLYKAYVNKEFEWKKLNK